MRLALLKLITVFAFIACVCLLFNSHPVDALWTAALSVCLCLAVCLYSELKDVGLSRDLYREDSAHCRGRIDQLQRQLNNTVGEHTHG